MKYFLLIFLTLCIFACYKNPVVQNEKPLARVFDKYLYISDLNGIVPSGISSEDSASIVKDFVEKWIRNQLLLNKAEINLSDREKDVEKQIESYRSSLLTYAYQQSYLQQELDTIVNDQEIQEYYKENQTNFILEEPLMKGVFIKLSEKAPEIYKLRQWYRSDDTESIKKLEGYCFSYATVYDHFNENWVNMNEVLRMIPSNDGSLENSLKNRKYLEARDKDFYYFVAAKEIALQGTVTPYEIVKNDIHYILLNKRKVKLINELETSIYSDAQNHEHFTIY